MQDAELIRMANQIAANLAALPEAEARAGIADHLRQFWDPRMRGQWQRILAARPAGLHPLLQPEGG